MRLSDVAKLIRSKNAGPFMLTIDILFEDDTTYHEIKKSNILNKKRISEIYGLDEDMITLIECDNCQAIKISFPRLVASGNVGDSDVFGGQQHGPLVNMEVQ